LELEGGGGGIQCCETANEKISELRKTVDEQMVRDRARDAQWEMRICEALRERALSREKKARTNGKRTRTILQSMMMN